MPTTHATTLLDQLRTQAERRGSLRALAQMNDGQWRYTTWSSYWQTVQQAARGLIGLGVHAGDTVAIVGDNRVEWVFGQFGIMAAGAIPAPIYQTNTVEQTAFIVNHAKAKIAFCDNHVQLDKLEKCINDGLVTLDKIITMDDIDHADERVMSFRALCESGSAADDAELAQRLDAIGSADTALLIYTSGTTGGPKAVQLDHGGMVEIADALLDNFPPFKAQGDIYSLVSYLPLCHVAEQLFTNMLHLATGGRIYFCPDLALLKDHLLAAEPTVFLGVPRVWEKMEAALAAKLDEAGGIRGRLAEWARATELSAFTREVETGKTIRSLSRWLANRLVISKIRRKLGFGNLVVAATGSAPIAVTTLEFFASLGTPLYESYGLSESYAIATCNVLGRPRYGTTGRAVRGVQLRIADDGEILVKGRATTKGYLYDEEQTAALYDSDGWLLSGDLGALDEQGYLRITGRKKELIITAGGKNVAPAEIEALLQRIDGVAHAVVVGDRKPYLSALLTLDPDSRSGLCAKLGLPDQDMAALTGREELRRYLNACIDEQCNAHLARYQRIKRFAVVPHPFSIETNELTPTLKVKRKVVQERYASEIESLYVTE